MGKRNKYRNYALEDIKNAVQMVENKSMSIRSASRQYNVPKTTIIDKLNGRSSLQARSGPNPVLYDSEEEMLVHWVIDMEKIGYGQTKQQLLYTVKKILDHDGRKTPFKDTLPGKDWLYAFMKRHPEISTRTPQKLGERFRYNPLEGFTEAVLGRTKTGWMDSELFYTWVRDHFITAIGTEKSSDRLFCWWMDILAILVWKQLSFPCDVTLFGPLKKHWRDSVRDYQFKNPGEFVTKGTFASVFKSAWVNATTVDVAIKGFRHTGLYPFSVESVDKSKVEPSAVFARAKSDQDLGNDDDMNCKDAQVDSRPVTNSSGTYILDPEPVQIADEAETEIALMPSEICDSISCKTSHTIVEKLHDQPPCLYPETIIKVNPCNVNVTPHKETNKHSREKAPSSSFELLLVTPNEQETLKKRKTRTVLPKAVSGSEMIKILENRKQQKEDEQEMKEKRKIDRELKRKLKEEENAKKEEKKNEKKKRTEENKKRKLSKNQKKSEKSTTSRLCSKCLLETDDVLYVARFAPPFIVQNALVLIFLVCILTTSLAFQMSVMIASISVRYST
ncbi:unnamed protein product [Mytilus coruscus]|uniref:HTH CENPB-type domain-containing protein n=1 Tax=Mytilus coruscus TaxID=42192 RepID=A0A6J8D9Q5_MYTCO|nr:unnamed protein product [Mytilus coruscus]